MKKYQLKIDPEALSDIHDIAEWYDTQKEGLSDRFKNAVIKQIDYLVENPQLFSIRYQEIRCMIVRKFPYMVHFYINEELTTVNILAVISTDRNPLVWKEKTSRI